MAYALKNCAVPFLAYWETVLGREIPLDVAEDNDSAIAIAKKGYSPALRHLERVQRQSIGFLGDLYDQQIMTISQCDTKDQAADIFTKALPPASWNNALVLLGMKIF